jgi:hypothetical protein
MQVFIVGSPLETAMALSKRHLNNQINEAKIILDALKGAKAWSNHPCVLQYRGYEMWLGFYKYCLEYYANGWLRDAKIENDYAESCKPSFHTQEYYDQMKRRLFEKDEEHYKQWADLGKSDCNWYYVDGSWRKYVNGKRIE